MNAPAACLFDLDGLLLDTEPCHARAWREAARNFGLELTERQLLALRGRRRLDNVEQVCRWIEASGRNVPDGQTLMAVQQPIARRLLPEALAMPGAPQLLERCHELAVATALVTSSSRESLAIKTAGHPWLEQIDLCPARPDASDGVAGSPHSRCSLRRQQWPPPPCGRQP